MSDTEAVVGATYRLALASLTLRRNIARVLDSVSTAQ
jgi:hypothetical protein